MPQLTRPFRHGSSVVDDFKTEVGLVTRPTISITTKTSKRQKSKEFSFYARTIMLLLSKLTVNLSKSNR